MVTNPITGHTRNDKLSKTVSVFVSKLKPLGTWKGQRLLDLGCGDGTFTLRFASGYQEIHGIDIQQDYLNAFRQKIQGDRRFHLHQMSSSSMEFSDHFFDGIMSFETLEHVADLPGTARETQRVLKPGGELLLTVPNRWFPCENHGADIGDLLSVNRAPFLTYFPPLHRKWSRARVFRVSDLDKLFLPLGMKRIAIDYLWPTFEHGGNRFQHLLRPFFRTMRAMENSPFPFRMFGTSLAAKYIKLQIPPCKTTQSS